MIAEIRTYTVKDGMLDSYLELFNRQIVPNHKKYGIPIIGAWADRQKSQITWIRTFASRDDRKAKLDVYESSPERDAVFPVATYHMSAHEVKVLENVLNAASEPDQSYFQRPIAIKAKQAYDTIPKAEAESFKASTAAPR
jgi:NIPSNAP